MNRSVAELEQTLLIVGTLNTTPMSEIRRDEPSATFGTMPPRLVNVQ